MLFTIEDLGFDIDTITSGTGYLNGGGENELLIAAAPNPDTSHRGRNRLEGRDGDDILIGSYGDDIFNPGSGDGYVFAGNGVDRVYIDHTGYTPATGADEVFINFTDTDNKKDFLIFGNDKRQFGTTLGTTFTEVTGWGEEDVLVISINNIWYYGSRVLL